MSFDFVLREISNTPVPFDILKSLHLNVMVLWLLLGFIGGLYFLIPEEVGRDVKHPLLIDVQFWFLLLIGIGIILSELFFTGKNWWLVEGREYVEAGRLWDILLTLGLLTVVYNVGMTIYERKRRISSPMLVLAAGAVGSILMYVPGEIWFDSLVAAEYFRWWVVHYWVEATFELIAAGAIALVLLSITDVKREIRLFSALEPVPLFLMAWAAYKDLKENKKPIQNKVALYTNFMSSSNVFSIVTLSFSLLYSATIFS